MRHTTGYLKRKKKPNRSRFAESDLCKDLFSWWKLQYMPQLGHVFLRLEVVAKNKTQQGILKAEGVRKGTADYFLSLPQTLPSGFYAGLYLEVKTTDGTASSNQREFLLDMRSRGYKALVGFGFYECHNIIKAYINQNESFLDGLQDFTPAKHRKFTESLCV